MEYPKQIGRYEIRRLIGRGGMAIVLEGWDPILHRTIAVKLVDKSKLESSIAQDALKRFKREAQAAARLGHPNIVQVYEYGEESDHAWIAMEYVAGTNLETLTDANKGTYPIDQACRMASQVLKELEHAHRHGFVHRDIKPENILIGREKGGLVAKISDFGLAKSFRGLGLSGLTFSGEMRGTVPFMPPEQMLDFKTVLPSGDLYSTAAPWWPTSASRSPRVRPAGTG